MPEYLSPGVYVEEIASGAHTITGVGTSTAGFIGVIAGSPISYKKVDRRRIGTVPQIASGGTIAMKIPFPPADLPPGSVPSGPEVWIGDTQKAPPASIQDGKLVLEGLTSNEALKPVKVSYTPQFTVATDKPAHCTSFNDFKRYFGDFSEDPGQRILAHAVLGFFLNGGTSCYVAVKTGGLGSQEEKIDSLLAHFEAIDEIALVAAPGLVSVANRMAIVNHCESMGDRFAILDGGRGLTPEEAASSDKRPANSNYAAFYMPWIEVSEPDRPGTTLMPPSGHLAGVYARVDGERGVHKAPANEVIRGALKLERAVSKAQQDGLNPIGVNCIRNLNGNIRVWGARTIGGKANGEWKYINVRRLFLYLRESIDESTQWVVFEPNDSALWAKITRNVTAFLTTVWRAGALFGATPEQAFYVKCDAETNPQEERELGRVVTEVGVAVVNPAEFVIFRISQWTGGAG